MPFEDIFGFVKELIGESHHPFVIEKGGQFPDDPEGEVLAKIKGSLQHLSSIRYNSMRNTVNVLRKAKIRALFYHHGPHHDILAYSGDKIGVEELESQLNHGRSIDVYVTRGDAKKARELLQLLQ